jgi:hypothetical protein
MANTYPQNPRGAGMRATFNGTTVVPRNLSPILRALEAPPPTQSIQVLDRIVIEEATYFIRWAEINATAAGNTTVVQGVGGKKLTIVSLEFVVSAAVSISWLSAASTIRNAQAFAANSGIVRDIVRPYYAQSFAGENLIMNLSAIANVRGALGYVEVGA